MRQKSRYLFSFQSNEGFFSLSVASFALSSSNQLRIRTTLKLAESYHQFRLTEIEKKKEPHTVALAGAERGKVEVGVEQLVHSNHPGRTGGNWISGAAHWPPPRIRPAQVVAYLVRASALLKRRGGSLKAPLTTSELRDHSKIACNQRARAPTVTRT